MPSHIILTAFGTTTRAQAAYGHLERHIAARFPDHMIHWAYSSPTVRKRSATGGAPRLSVREIIDSLGAGCAVVVQSLHVLPGREFERVEEDLRRAGGQTALGRPLLSTTADLHRLADCLQPLIAADPHDAVLVLGHGTAHPCRAAYSELALILQRRHGPRLFLSTLEFPDTAPESIAAHIAAAGHRRVVVLPLLLVAGMHFYRDITGDANHSWRQLLSAQRIEMKIHDQGLAMLPGVADMFCDHIGSALPVRKA